jgi:transposase
MFSMHLNEYLLTIHLTSNGAALMRQFVVVGKSQSQARNSGLPKAKSSTETHAEVNAGPKSFVFTGYLSDLSDDEGMLEEDNKLYDDEADISDHESDSSPRTSAQLRIHMPPPLKRRRLEIPYREARKRAREERREELQNALFHIEKTIASKRTKFAGGHAGLQARRTHAIQSYLFMVVKNGRKGMDASKIAAEAQGFSPKWGAKLVRKWVREWIRTRTLPASSRGHHVKTFSLLEDPAIRAELRSYLRSNKWAINPARVVEFSSQTMIPEAAKKYLREVTEHEMPAGLKKYIELELFPRIQHKVKKGISLETARRFLHAEGFRYVEHKKAVYYDGHERPDVVEYRQDTFIPLFDSYRKRIIEYDQKDPTKEIPKDLGNIDRLVLLPQDEMTTQANDGNKKSWVLDGETPLKKKGVGRGIHCSNVICACHGYIAEAGQYLEYGKNYDGYWNGELFVKQVRVSRF